MLWWHEISNSCLKTRVVRALAIQSSACVRQKGRSVEPVSIVPGDLGAQASGRWPVRPGANLDQKGASIQKFVKLSAPEPEDHFADRDGD